jgi:CheY-like chemotaxis protein
MKIAHILLVEDDQLDTMDICRSLDKTDLVYQLHTAKNGEEALNQLSRGPGSTLESLPDIILLDINMPKMNGLEFLEALRASDEWKDLKCFVITTSDDYAERDKAARLGVSGYIIKPLKLNSPTSMDAFNLMIDLMNL